jgi:class 3 adenylate cyclase
MTEGPLAGRRIAVDTQLVVGRVDADVTIDDPLISRRHAVIRPVDGALEIEDLGSLNGTWVNGERVDGARRLGSGDVIRVGDAAFAVEGASSNVRGTVLGPLARGTTASPRDARVDDELRLVTALFADVVGSTSLGERLGPDEVKLVIGDFVTRMSRAVEQFGGIVQAYMGDGIAAFFGVPRAHEDDAERAARAALAILATTAEFVQELAGAWEITAFDVRIGINTGPAAVGLVGAAAPQSVSVGDTTNVAARLQSAAEPGSIVVGNVTAKALMQSFALEPLGDVAVKGRAAPISAWRLVGAQTALRNAPELPLIGRDAETARLQQVLDDVVAGRGQVGILLGEAGLGKTRLLAEVRLLAAGRATWLEGSCFSYGTEVVYGPFIQILKSWIGAEEGEAELSVRTKLRAKLGLLPSSRVADVLPHLARLLSLTPDPRDEERREPSSPADRARQIRDAYRTWLASLAENGPVVVAVDDVHWVDPSSRELIEELLELAEQLPLLVLMTLRVDPASDGWGVRVHALADHPHRTTELRLTPLDDAAALRLLEALPRTRDLGTGELDLIVKAAEGNPLYLQELLNAFTESSTSRAGRTWAPTVTGQKVLTPTLESLLLARIDALPDEARRLVQLAAVIGRSFPLRVLEHVADIDDVEARLTEVVRADIVRELGRYPEREYVFRHGLLWQACLATLPPARLRALHGAVAVAFEALFGPSRDEHLEVIAHHYARSDHLNRALEYLELAGERAASLDADESAAELWRRALKVARKLGDDGATERVQKRLELHGASSE